MRVRYPVRAHCFSRCQSRTPLVPVEARTIGSGEAMETPVRWMKRSPHFVIVAVWLLWALPASAGRIVLIGNEFLVNTATTGDQVAPAAATLSDGSFVVVWQSTEELGYCRRAYELLGTTIRCSGDEDCRPDEAYPFRDDYCDSVSGIFGQRFDSDAEKLGTEFRLDESAIALRSVPDVVSLPGGSFVVAWYDPLGTIDVRIFDAEGVPRGSLFQLGQPGNYPRSPRLASDANGRFIIVWTERNNAIRAARYSSSGEVLQSEITVKDPDAFLNHINGKSVAMNSTGEFIVTWTREHSSSVHFRRFQPDGILTEPTIVVDGVGDSYGQRVALYDDAQFMVAWEAYYTVSGGFDYVRRIRGQWYDPDARPLGMQFPISNGNARFDAVGAIEPLSGHEALVAWSGSHQIAARVFDAHEGPQSEPTLVSGANVGGSGVDATVLSSDQSHQFVVVWRDSRRFSGGDADMDVFARRARFERGNLCVADCNGDGIVSINELVTSVSIALGTEPHASCPRIDVNGDGFVTISELSQGVKAALEGCIG